MTTRLTFEITMDSDFHVGSGYRKGSEIDSGMLREGDGRPALRGSLLGQLLRDAARELLLTPALSAKGYNRCTASSGEGDHVPTYCRGGVEGHGECPICWIFGSPAHPRHWEFSSAWLKEAGESGLERTPENTDWAAQAATRVRINPRTRRAADDQLFVEEVGDSRLVFQFAATWNQPGKVDDSEIAFLVAAARNMRHLGKSRRRGRGACQVQLVAVDDQPVVSDQWLDRFAEAWINGTWLVPQQQLRAEVLPVSETEAGALEPYRVQVVARLEEPLLLARRALAGNQFESLSFLPGSVLLGALAARSNFADPGRYSRLVRLFRLGYVRFPFLSPALAKGNWLYPAFSAPLDVFRCKLHPASEKTICHPDQSASLFGQDQIVHCPLCEKNNDAVEGLKGREAIQTLISGRLVAFTLQRREEMHIRLNSKTQRVQAGDLFSYVTLEAGQYLVGELNCRNKETWQMLRDEVGLPGPDETLQIRLGKGIRRGYGLVSVAFFPDAENLLPSLKTRLENPFQPFRVLLLTDAIITDRWGRFPTHFDAEWLLKELGFDAHDDQASIKILRGFARTRPIDTFNNHIGLPRWRDQALVAGSAVGVQIKVDGLSVEEVYKRLENVEKMGIGLRRNEGYGQIIINHPLYAELVDRRDENSIQILLPITLRGRPTIETNPAVTEEAFCIRWNEELGENWKDVEYVEFAAVARFLRSGSDQPIQRLKRGLQQLGQPDATRLPGRPLLPADPKRPYAPRTKKDFFSEGKGKNGFELIIDKLDALNGMMTITDRQRALAVLMLADRVTETVKSAQRKEMKQ